MKSDAERIVDYRRQMKHLNETLREKNRDLDALHYVWCSGGCTGGAHRWSENNITGAKLRRAERLLRRTRSWHENRIHRRWNQMQHEGRPWWIVKWFIRWRRLMRFFRRES